jgi:two-component system, LytTR family, sensor kinase
MASIFPYVRQQGWGIVENNTVGWGVLFCASFLLRPICSSLLKSSLSWFQLELRAFIWCSLVGTLAAVLIQMIVHHFQQFDWIDLASNSVKACMAMLFWCNLYFRIKEWQRSSHERQRLANAEADAREARLAALRYQLNPHFLFNSLNAVSTLVLEGEVDASTRMLSQIADLLRTSLDQQLPWEVSLAQEMTFTEKYLAIEQTRLGERLRVDLAISMETLEAAVPSMLLQPLVENAIRHGVAAVVEAGSVAIESKLQGSQLQIIIRNTGSRRVNPGRSVRGIGLTNTSERLQTLYGVDHRFDLKWPEDGGCEVLIEIPFHRFSYAGE